MTIKRIIAFNCVCSLLFPLLFGQNQMQFPDTTHLTVEQLQMFESMAIDTVDGELDVPNVFSPNGDDINDFFEVTTDGTTAYEFSVFTRNGTRIYHSLSTRIFWDGRSIGGQELPKGIYYYVIEEIGDPDPFTNAGFMHLFR